MHLDHHSNLSPQEAFEHRSRLSAQIGLLGDFEPRKVAEALVEIKAVADDMLVADDLAT